MTRPTDPLFDRRIADWLEDDPRRAPGRVLDNVLAALPSIPQRRAMRMPWGFQGTPMLMRLAAAAMIGVLVVGGAFYVIRRGQPALLGGPSNPPSIAPVPSASVTPSPSPTLSRTSSVVQSKPGTFAFIRPSGNGPQLWVANMDGTGERAGPGPGWKSGLCRLVAGRDPPGLLAGSDAPMGDPEGTTRLYLVDASGGAPQLVDTGCVAPCSGDSDAAF